MRIRIDNREIEAREGETIVAAARAAGITIPTVCHLKGTRGTGSCMVCGVRVVETGRFVPACATGVTDGLAVENSGEAVEAFRRGALELLLSDHLGECVAMCRRACPVGLDVSRLMGLVEAGEVEAAGDLLAESTVLPRVVARGCHRPCEKVCRRGALDAAVGIREVERFVGDRLSAGEQGEPTGEAIAVAGAGPTGVSAAVCLARLGYTVEVFDPAGQALSSLRGEVEDEAIEGDLAGATAAGVRWRLGEPAPEASSAAAQAYRVVLLATGPEAAVGEEPSAPVFAAGRCRKAGLELIERVSAGVKAAAAIDRFLKGGEAAEKRGFRSVLRRLDREEMGDFVANLEASAGGEGRLTSGEAAATEAARCGHCECDVAGSCELRQWSGVYRARQRHFGASGARYRKRLDLPNLVFEPGKCILCGHCVRVAAAAERPMQLSLTGRGFTTTLTSSDHGDDPALAEAAAACVRVCPTGALRLK